MAHRRLSTLLIALAVIGACAVGAYAATTGGTPQGTPLKLSGSVENLIPGETAIVPVSIVNLNDREVTVSSVETTVSSPKTGCPASALTVSAIEAPVTVPSGGTRTASLPVTLEQDAPDRCQGVAFGLAFKTQGVGPDLPGDNPVTPPPPVTPSGGTKTVTKIVKKKVCKRVTIKVRVKGKVKRKRVTRCRTVITKVQVQVPA